MKLPDRDRWVLDHRNDPEALSKRISALLARRQLSLAAAWLWGIAGVLDMIASLTSLKDYAPVAIGSAMFTLSAFSLISVSQCSSEIRVLSLLHSECAAESGS